MLVRLRVVLILLGMLITISPVLADKYRIDGNISDWGVDLKAGLCHDVDGICDDSGHKNAWVPTNDTVDWIVEDDIDPQYYSSGSPAYLWGVHIESTMNPSGFYAGYIDYKEPKLKRSCVAPDAYQPSGGEYWDVEALYFDDDKYYLYFAIVVSNNLSFEKLCTNSGSAGYLGPGDLYLKIGDREFGIVIKDHEGLKSGQIYENPSWHDDLYDECGACGWSNVDKSLIDGKNPGTYVGMAEVAIAEAKDSNGDLIRDYELPNYIIEIKVDRTKIAYPTQGTYPMKFALSCGNDFIEKEVTYNYNTIPEFGAILIPAGIILGFFYYHRNRHK